MKTVIFSLLLVFTAPVFAEDATDIPEIDRHYVSCDPVDASQARCLLWYYQDPGGTCYEQYILIKDDLSVDVLKPTNAATARCDPADAHFEQTLFNPSIGTCSDFYTRRDGITTSVIAIPTEEDAC